MRERLFRRFLNAPSRLWRAFYRYAVLRKPVIYYLQGELGRINRELLALECAAKAGVPTHLVDTALLRGGTWFVRMKSGVVMRMKEFLDNPPHEIRWPDGSGITKEAPVTAG